MNRLTILLGILGVGLVLLIINHDGGRTFGLANDDFGQLVTLGAVGAMLAAGVVRSRRTLPDTLRQFGIWVVLFLAVISAYLYRGDLEAYAARLMGGLVPGRAAVFTDNEGYQEVVLHKLSNGHFETGVTIDGRPVRMMVDTGATTVALSYEDAEAIGIDPATLTYSARLMTANGEARGAPVTLSSVAIGPIERTDIRAIVAEKGKLDQSLLGMSFLATLDFLQMQTDELRLRD